jgi:Ca2+-binding EF-hand superfamily protein
VFDGDDDLLINFEEFVKAMNILMLPSASNDKDGLVEEKLKFSFQVYDEDKDNKISKVELSNAFSDVMDTRNITITKAQLAAVVNATFKQASTANADFITYEEYRGLIKSNPNSLQNFIAAYSVDIDAALQNAAAMHRAAKQKKKK